MRPRSPFIAAMQRGDRPSWSSRKFGSTQISRSTLSASFLFPRLTARMSLSRPSRSCGELAPEAVDMRRTSGIMFAVGSNSLAIPISTAAMSSWVARRSSATLELTSLSVMSEVTEAHPLHGVVYIQLKTALDKLKLPPFRHDLPMHSNEVGHAEP